jgi:hypothetical protein
MAALIITTAGIKHPQQPPRVTLTTVVGRTGCVWNSSL